MQLPQTHHEAIHIRQCDSARLPCLRCQSRMHLLEMRSYGGGSAGSGAVWSRLVVIGTFLTEGCSRGRRRGDALETGGARGAGVGFLDMSLLVLLAFIIKSHTTSHQADAQLTCALSRHLMEQ